MILIHASTSPLSDRFSRIGRTSYATRLLPSRLRSLACRLILTGRRSRALSSSRNLSLATRTARYTIPHAPTRAQARSTITAAQARRRLSTTGLPMTSVSLHPHNPLFGIQSTRRGNNQHPFRHSRPRADTTLLPTGAASGRLHLHPASFLLCPRKARMAGGHRREIICIFRGY